MMQRIARALAGRTRRLGLTSASLAAVGVTLAHVWPVDSSGIATATVVEAPFRDALVERGTVDAAHLIFYSSTIAGVQAKILDIVPEGTAVSPGQVLVRFDAAPFEDAVARELAAVAQGEAEVLRAGEDVRQEELRSTADVDAARDQVAFAETALASERDGKGPLAVAEAEAAANDAARELARARTTADDMQALLKQGFVTRVEADRADQALRQAEDRERLAALKLSTLKTFEAPAAIDKSKADVASAAKNLNSTTAAASSRLVQRRAALALVQNRLIEARARLANARDQVARTVVRSETAGLVVYRELFFGTERRKPAPGDEVWPNQPIIAVPDPAQLVVQTRVRELDLHKIAAGARVTVSVDAYPGLALPASVSLVGALAQDDPTRAGTRFFPVTVKLLTPDARLRTGMSARVEIEVAALDKAVLVPVQALIVDANGTTRCDVVESRGVVSRQIDVEAKNDLVAAVRRGLRPGDRVRLIDPARAPETPR